MGIRHFVFSEDIDGTTYWGVYDNETDSVLEWYATQNEAEQYLCVSAE